MILPTQLAEHASRYGAWAESKPQIRRLWLYGSRIKGAPRPDSDLDIAIEILPIRDEQDKEIFIDRTFREWRVELQNLSHFTVHLEPWASEGTDVAKYVEETGVLIYAHAA